MEWEGVSRYRVKARNPTPGMVGKNWITGPRKRPKRDEEQRDNTQPRICECLLGDDPDQEAFCAKIRSIW